MNALYITKVGPYSASKFETVSLENCEIAFGFRTHLLLLKRGDLTLLFPEFASISS